MGRQRRAVVIVGALVFLAIAIVVILLVRTPPVGVPPSATPSGSPSHSSSPEASSASPAQPPPAEASTDTSEAGGNPVQPPVPVTPPVEPVPVPQVPASLQNQDLTAIPGAGRVVALTFDAGANAAGLPKILSVLSAKGVTGTFFLTGNWAEANQEGVAQIVSSGHRVANHSMSHPGFTGLSENQIAQEIQAAEQVILASGADPRPLFRFPFGERDSRTISAVNDLGYVAVRWSVDTLGWKGTSGGINAQIVADRTMAGLQPGGIVLMHIGSNPDDGTTLDADALPHIIDRISAAGYGFVTLDALLAP